MAFHPATQSWFEENFSAPTEVQQAGWEKIDQRDALMRDIPLGRLGSAQDIAEAVAYLAAPAGAYLTGQTLHVNGGMFMP